MQNFTPAYMNRCTYVRTRTDDFLRTKIYWMYRQPNFLTNGSTTTSTTAAITSTGIATAAATATY